RQTVPSVPAAASAVATNVSSTDGLRVGTSRQTPAAKIADVTTRRRTSVLRGPRAALARRNGKEVRVLAGQDLVDDRFDRPPRIRRVVGHVIAGRIDAGNFGTPVLGQELIRIAVARRERADLGVVETLQTPLLDQRDPAVGVSQVNLVVGE